MRLHRPSSTRTSSPTTLSSRRAFVGHSVRCSCTVIRTYVCIHTSCFLAHTPIIHISGYTPAYPNSCLSTRVRFLLRVSLFCFSIAYLRRSRSRPRLRHLERRHVRHRDLQGDLRRRLLRSLHVCRYGAVRARIRTLLVSLRRCEIISHACGWRPRPRRTRRRRRIGRTHSACMP